MKNKILELRAQQGISLEKLSDLTHEIAEKFNKKGQHQISGKPYNGISAQQLNRLEKSERRLNEDNKRLIAEALNVPAKQVAGYDSEMVAVLGTIREGNFIHPLGNLSLTKGMAEHEKKHAECEFVEAPPEGLYRNIAAIKVEGDSMEPFMSSGTVVYYAERKTGDLSEYLNKLCVVHLKSGKTVLKKLKKSMTYGRYTLSSFNTQDMEDAEIDWCAKVIFIRPA